MFDHITVTRQGLSGAPIDLGTLAECLLFYRKVRVVSDVDILKYLMRCCGPEDLLRLIEMGALEIEFFEIYAISTVQTNQGALHELKTFTTETLKYQRVSRLLFEELAGPSGKGVTRLFSEIRQGGPGIHLHIRHTRPGTRDFLDYKYLTAAVRGFLALLAPEYPIPALLKFDVYPVSQNGGYHVRANVNFSEANESYQKHVPSGFGELTPAYLMLQILETRRDLMIGSRQHSDFALAPARAAAASSKFAELLMAAETGTKAAELFQEEVIDGLPSIKEVVNSGDKTFADVISLIEKAEKFKAWGGQKTRIASGRAICRKFRTSAGRRSCHPESFACY